MLGKMKRTVELTTPIAEMKTPGEKERDFMENVFHEHEDTKCELEKKWKQLKQQWGNFKEEMMKLRENENYFMEKLFHEHEETKCKLEQKWKELEQQWEHLEKCEVRIDHQQKKIEHEKKMKEKAELHKKIIELEQKLDEKEGELDAMEALNKALILNEHRLLCELQDTRKALINVFEPRYEQNISSNIGLKRMGGLDCKSFLLGAKRKFRLESEEVVEGKAMELCSFWEEHLKDPSWHPFKIIMENEEPKEVIDEEDGKLKELKGELGEESYGAVITALMELNAYNPSGRYPFSEIWNYKEDRIARLNEVVADLVNQWEMQKAKRKRGC